jgi:hypothetical protein
MWEVLPDRLPVPDIIPLAKSAHVRVPVSSHQLYEHGILLAVPV